MPGGGAAARGFVGCEVLHHYHLQRVKSKILFLFRVIEQRFTHYSVQEGKEQTLLEGISAHDSDLKEKSSLRRNHFSE